MKKISLIALALLVVVLLVAAVPAPLHKISGILQYQRSSDVQYPDFLDLPVMDKVHLSGWIFPSQGQYEGCRIDALGVYLPSSGISQYKLFKVYRATIACPDIVVGEP